MDYYKNLDLADIRYFNDEGVLCVEKWKDIPMFEGYYQASDLGRIKRSYYSIMAINNSRNVAEKIMKARKCPKKGYLKLSLTVGGKRSYTLVHRLVAITFLPNPYNLPEVNHKFGIKHDNRVTEIEWSTHLDNMRHAVASGLKVARKGAKSSYDKLTEELVLEIRKIGHSVPYTETAKIYGVSSSQIERVVKRIQWAHI